MATLPPVPRHGWISRRTWTGAIVCIALVGGSYGYTNPDVEIDCRHLSLACGPTDADRIAGWSRASVGTLVLVGITIMLVALMLGVMRRHEPRRAWVARHRLAVAVISATVLALTVAGSRSPSLRCPIEDGAMVHCLGPPSRSDHVVAILDAAFHSLSVAVPLALALVLFTIGWRKLERLWNYSDAELAMIAARSEGASR